MRTTQSLKPDVSAAGGRGALGQPSVLGTRRIVNHARREGAGNAPRGDDGKAAPAYCAAATEAASAGAAGLAPLSVHSGGNPSWLPTTPATPG